MNPRICTTLLVLALVPTLGTVAVCAERKPPARTAPLKPGEKKETAPQHTTITTISSDSITIAEAKGSKTFKITKDTEIELKGQKAKPEDLKPGMRVSVSMGSDPETAARISASDPPKEAPASDKDKKK